MPARGRIARLFDPSVESGPLSKGVVIQTLPSAQVVAPFDGHVVFQGPFRGYGSILIIEHADGYHTLLSGLGRIDAAVGQWLLAGEPVGVMGSDGTPELYVELRRASQPIDPLPWLRISGDKVKG
jgi:septal ring factor EnvC (AmiA/AmiB activator)